MNALFHLSTRSYRRGLAGVTLLELMVLIGLAGVLLLLMAGGWGSFRGRSEAVACMQRMKQAGTIALIRAQEHQGHLLWKDLAYSPRTDEQMWKTPLIREGLVSDPKIFFCPSTKVLEAQWTNPYLGFGLRSCDELRTTHPGLLGGNWGPLPQPDGRNAGKRTIVLFRIAEPSRFILWADSISPNRGGSYSGMPSTSFSMNTRNGETSGIQLRHQGRANVMFADGHMGALDGLELKEYGATSAFTTDFEVVIF